MRTLVFVTYDLHGVGGNIKKYNEVNRWLAKLGLRNQVSIEKKRKTVKLPGNSFVGKFVPDCTVSALRANLKKEIKAVFTQCGVSADAFILVAKESGWTWATAIKKYAKKNLKMKGGSYEEV
jgi:roadblock/LC7 domain-containing protein